MLTSQQAEWLVTFYRNLPGQRGQQLPLETAYPQFQREEVTDNERYPYFDMRSMTPRR